MANQVNWTEVIRRVIEEKDRRDKMTLEQKAKESVEFERPFHKYTARKPNPSIRCMVGGCYQTAINSHVISKNQYLENIAVGHQVMRIQSRDSFSGNTENRQFVRSMVLNPIGINDATVFKGYCKAHDNNLFKNVDNEPIRSWTDILLQCLRTIDFSLYSERWATNELRALQKRQADLIGVEAFRELHKGQLDLTEPILQLQEYILKKLNADASRFPLTIGTVEIGAVLELQENYQVHFRRVFRPIPLAMYNYFHLSNGHMIYVITLPAKHYIDCILICNREYNLGSWWQQISTDDLSVLNFLECCMVASECWVASPIIFEGMSEEKKALFQSDIYNKHGFKLLANHQDYDVSVFDDIRRNIIAGLSDNYRKVLEEYKLTNLPSRVAKCLDNHALSGYRKLQENLRWNI